MEMRLENGPHFARENVTADVRRSGADMCPACLTRRTWPLALMRSAGWVSTRGPPPETGSFTWIVPAEQEAIVITPLLATDPEQTASAPLKVMQSLAP